MASIFKRKRDARKRNAPWYLAYNDHTGKRRMRKGFTDRGLTEQLAAKLENEAMLRKRGLIDPDDEAVAERRKTPIAELLSSFEKSLQKSDNTSKHVQLTMSRIRRIVEDGSIETPADIDIEAVEEVVREMLESEEIGHKTYNHYVQAMYQFSKWLTAADRAILPSNPLAGVERLNTEVDIRHPRRALTPDEFTKLVDSALASDIKIQCFDGEARARIYLVSYFTGLRRKEIGSLMPRSFALATDPPTVTVQAACSKHRRKDVLPLHPELVEMLREWLPTKQPNELLFPKLEKRRTWLMVRRDLERVGIPYENDEGIADFHAAGRHTHITQLLRNGATLAEAKELARHCDVRMTMKYTHIGIDDQAKALVSLPSPNSKGWQRIGSASDGSNGHSMAQRDTGNGDDRGDSNAESAEVGGTSDTDRHSVAHGARGTPNDSSRVRFPPPPLPKFFQRKSLGIFHFLWQRIGSGLIAHHVILWPNLTRRLVWLAVQSQYAKDIALQCRIRCAPYAGVPGEA